MNCENCPCTASGVTCLAREDFCEWARRGDTNRFLHIVNRSRIAENPAEYPPIAVQAGNALGAATRITAAALAGEPVLAGAEVRDRRLAICAGCDRFDAEAGRCRECGCFVAVKSALATEECPLGKWPPIVAVPVPGGCGCGKK